MFMPAIITTRCKYIKKYMILGCARTVSMIRLTAPMRALACETQNVRNAFEKREESVRGRLMALVVLPLHSSHGEEL